MGVWPPSRLLAAELRVDGHAALVLRAPSSSPAPAPAPSSSAAAASSAAASSSAAAAAGARSTRLAGEVAGLC